MDSDLISKSKKIIQNTLIVCAVIIVLYLLLFVHPPQKGKPDRVTIDLWHVSGADESEPQVPLWFNEEQDEIYANQVGVPFLEIERKFLTSIIGNVPPDIFEYFGPVAQWSSRGALLPLNEYMERDGFDKSKFFEVLWDEVTWEGKIYAIPIGTACDAFYWNKEHFREAGLDPDRPPKTWSELEEYAEKLFVYDKEGNIKRAGYIPGYWSAGNTPGFIFWPMEFDAEFLSPDGRKVNMTSDACVKSLEWEGRLFQKLGGDKLIRMRSSFGYGTQQGFASKRLSMIVQKSSFIQELSKYAPDIEFGVSMLPVPDEGGHPGSTSGALWVGIPSGSQHPEEAWEYIKFYTRQDVLQRSADYAIDNDQVAFFPANIEVAKSPKQMSTPYMDVLIDTMKWARTPTIVPLAHAIFWREYQNAWDQVVRGQKSAREALEAAEKEVQRALDDQIDYNEFYTEYLRKKEAEISSASHDKADGIVSVQNDNSHKPD